MKHQELTWFKHAASGSRKLASQPSPEVLTLFYGLILYFKCPIITKVILHSWQAPLF